MTFGLIDEKQSEIIKAFFIWPRGATSIKYIFKNDDFGKVFIRYKDKFELCYIMQCKCGNYYPMVIERRVKR